MTFTRRFGFDPGQEVITQIEGIVLIGREPPGSTTGAGSGAALVVGEFEDGPFIPTEVEGGGDLLATFGGFGYTVDGLVSCNPCARGRKADGATSFEYWNGNGFISLVSKKWGRIMVCRVDTSVGVVEFTRRPSLDGSTDNTWDLEPAQTLVFDLGSGSVTATFDAAVASLLSADGTYNTTFVGGESMNVTIDAGTSQQIGPIDIVFQSGDQTHAQVVTRINTVLGYTAAATSTLKTTLVGRNRGTAGSVKVNSVSGAIVTTATGFSVVAAEVGTGDVSNIDAVTFLEAKARIEADVSGTRVERANDNAIRVVATAVASLRFVASSTAVAFGFTAAQVSQEPDGFATLATTAGTYPDGFVGGETLTLGFDGDPDVTVSFIAGDTTRALVIDRINAAVGFTAASAHATATKIILTGRVNGGEVRVVAGSAGVFTALGMAAIAVTAIAHSNDVIPAGTRVRNSAAVEWVTMQSTTVAFNDDGPYELLVRPALDDGTNAGTTSSSVTVLPSGVGSYAWTIDNPSALTAALTEAALDAAYQTAFDATLAQSSIAKEDNIILSARQSNACRSAVRMNVIAAAGAGMAGRIGVISPPLGTTRTRAKASGVQPGVGTTRNKDVIYAFPGVNIFVPQIAARGVSGGAGFTADGLIDVHADSWEAATMSQLPPEQNPGQQTDFMAGVRSLEVGNSDVQSMTIDDYIAFKRAGIAAPIIDAGVCQIQSAVTSVDPTVNPGNVDISQRRFEYFIQDSLVALCKRFSKRLMTRLNRADFLGVEDQFLLSLKSPGNPSGQRLEDYSIDAISPNTKQSLGAGIFRTIVRVRMISDFKYIVFETLVGPNVDVTITLKAA